MAQENEYRAVYEQRVKDGKVKAPKGDNNSITVEGAIDTTGPNFPKVPPKQGPTLPVDDAFSKLRTSQA